MDNRETMLAALDDVRSMLAAGVNCVGLMRTLRNLLDAEVTADDEDTRRISAEIVAGIFGTNEEPDHAS